MTGHRAYPEGMGSEQPVCPACGQPVEKIVGRHKTLGVWVPVWVPGPCRNRECEKSPDHEADAAAPPEPGAVRRNTEGEAPTAR